LSNSKKKGNTPNTKFDDSEKEKKKGLTEINEDFEAKNMYDLVETSLYFVSRSEESWLF